MRRHPFQILARSVVALAVHIGLLAGLGVMISTRPRSQMTVAWLAGWLATLLASYWWLMSEEVRRRNGTKV